MKPVRVEVVAAGTTHAVVVEPGDAPGRYRITIDDGAPALVDAVGAADNGTTTWSLRDVDAGTVSIVAVTIGPTGDGDAVVGGHAVPVALVTRRRRAKAALGAGDGEQRVLAPMPGKVVKVLVAAGDAVTARQGLVVVEAMKMENELTATRAGTVTSVVVAEGDSVEAGRLLVVVS
jgi:biotin carboxyl carrier protein